MTNEVDPVRRDVQSLPDSALMIYEAIATLEFCGQRPSLSNIARTTSLDLRALEEELAELTRRGLILISDEEADDAPTYVPAQRGWSAVPEEPEGHQAHERRQSRERRA
jgi:predicted transcriptional regulator